MTAEDFQLVGFSVSVALAATVLLLPFGVALAYALSRYDGRGRVLLETIVTLPLVLPPTAVGLLLLELLSRDAFLGRVLDSLGVEVLFTPKAAVIASAVMALPLLVRTSRAAFDGVDRRYVGVARTLGHSRMSAFLRVTLPLAGRGIGAGALLAFSRALGEFGATVLIAGNIPGRTQTLSLAIFQRTQLGDDAAAMRLVGVVTAIAFVAVYATERLGRPSEAR